MTSITRGRRVKPEPTTDAIPITSPLSYRLQSQSIASPAPSVQELDSEMTGTEHPHQEPDAAAADDQVSNADQSSNSSDNGIDILGRQVKQMVQAIDKLQTLGVETKGLPLPKIVVVGDQSAGKSSLIEGISGIKVPRSSGTCTRCPLQITLTPTDSIDSRWSCTITLQKHYDYYSSATLPGGSKDSPFGNWGKKDIPQEIPFAQTYDKSALEELIRRAQFACLNPGDKPAKYLDAADVSELPLRVQFSPNIVRLDIKEATSPSLSFVDLPGVINQTEVSSDRWLVGFVKQLVKEYISNPNTLILLACSMESDMANSSASQLVDDCEDAKERCVGVLTKPDRRPVDDNVESIRKVLANQSFCVGHGYYVAMQPSQVQLDQGISTDDARRHEADFFASHPWSTALGAYSDRFGTSQLQLALSKKLTDQIVRSLPDICQRIETRLSQVDEELQGYPDPPANAMTHIIEALTVFKLVTERHIEGQFPNNEFRSENKRIAINFKNNLQALSPALRISTPASHLRTTVSLLSDDESEADPPTPCPPSAKRHKTATGSSSLTSTPKLKSAQKPGAAKSDQNQPVQKKTFTLSEIREALDNLTMCDIPQEIDLRAVDFLRSQCLSGWQQPMEIFINETTALLREKLHRLLNESCKKWENSEFYRETEKMVAGFVDSAMTEVRRHSQRALNLELFKPFTLNEDDIKRKQQEELETIEEKRLHRRIMEHLEKTESRINGKQQSNEDRIRKIDKDPKTYIKLLGADPFQREIEVMAKVRGYYRMAMFRFLERVVQESHQGLEQCRTDLHQQLFLGLELNTEGAHENCGRLLAEDPMREAHRVLLKNERQKLVEAQQWLSRLDVPEL